MEHIIAPNGDDRSAIGAILARQGAAWQAGDATAFAADTQEGILFTNIVGMFSIGRAAFIGQHAHIFSTIYQGSTMAQEIVAITLIRPDVAIVDTLAVLVDAPHRTSGIELIDGAVRTRLEQVMGQERRCMAGRFVPQRCHSSDRRDGCARTRLASSAFRPPVPRRWPAGRLVRFRGGRRDLLPIAR